MLWCAMLRYAALCCAALCFAAKLNAFPLLSIPPNAPGPFMHGQSVTRSLSLVSSGWDSGAFCLLPSPET